MNNPRWSAKEEIIRNILSKAGDKIFAVSFTKRTTGEVRNMRARLHVKPKYELNDQIDTDTDHRTSKFRTDLDIQNGTLTVFEMNGKRSSFKRVSLESVKWIQVKGVRLNFDGEVQEKERRDFNRIYW